MKLVLSFFFVDMKSALMIVICFVDFETRFFIYAKYFIFKIKFVICVYIYHNMLFDEHGRVCV